MNRSPVRFRQEAPEKSGPHQDKHPVGVLFTQTEVAGCNPSCNPSLSEPENDLFIFQRPPPRTTPRRSASRSALQASTASPTALQQAREGHAPTWRPSQAPQTARGAPPLSGSLRARGKRYRAAPRPPRGVRAHEQECNAAPPEADANPAGLGRGRSSRHTARQGARIRRARAETLCVDDPKGYKNSPSHSDGRVRH